MTVGQFSKKEKVKEGDGLVIADLKGPGCIYRIWTPTPTDDSMEFYFDEETTPRVKLKYRDLFGPMHWQPAPLLKQLATAGQSLAAWETAR